ncbi:globin family protein [Methylobrevis pamukkalensis]|uniref:Bacterial hemoglobin n=1 Tax=Methylobrevis pamukkalensis TaxID=1439726 RepID=A0A1E3H4Z3_9HYPH|nr:globin family protein [Methylobrevis pamukkalensis]ODN71407.1 Bacterial hemoglobin [Methylobrevis pamukkalensis]
MTPEEIRLVQDSFREIQPSVGVVANVFYAHLFSMTPALRPLFPHDMSGQKIKLMKMIEAAVDNLHHFDLMRPTIRSLGARHVGYGVRDEHYDLVGAALLHTVAAALGDGWTTDIEDAWLEVYGRVAGEMKDAAAATA